MKPSTQLHQLIRSLTPSEKGYFKKMAGAQAGNETTGYLKLFEAIDEQEEYNETAIAKKFSREKWAKNLAVTKNYLYGLLLKLLRNYHQQHSRNAQINAQIENSDLLFSKGMYQQSFGELSAATEDAIAFDQPLKLLEIKSKERALLLEIAASDWDKAIGENIAETQKIIDDYNGYIQLFNIYFRVMHFWRHQRTIRTKEDKAYLDKLMKHPLLQSACPAKGFYTPLIYRSIHMAYSFITNNDAETLKHTHSLLKHWDKHPQMKEVEPLKYIAAINNQMNLAFKIIDLKLVKETISRLEKVATNNNDAIDAVIFENRSTAKFVLLFAECRFTDAEKFLVELDKNLKKYEPKINPVRLLLLKFNTMILHWVQNNISKAIDVAGEMLNEKNIDLRQDVQATVRMIYLILHFEYGNSLMLQDALRSSKRYLQSRRKFYETEKVFFKYLLKLNLRSNEKERKEVYTKMSNELEQVLQQFPLEKNLQQTFDVFNWLNPKLQGISLKQYLISTNR